MLRARDIPNWLTLARLLLAVVVFVCLDRAAGQYRADPSSGAPIGLYQWAFWLWLVAALTDTLDGWLARRNNWVSALGRVADPVADKVLTLGGLIYLACDPLLASRLPVWAVIVVLTREFLVTTLRGMVEAAGKPFPSDRYGKIKMFAQSYFAIAWLGINADIPGQIHFPLLAYAAHEVVLVATFWGMVGLTALSMAAYSLRGIRILAEARNEG